MTAPTPGGDDPAEPLSDDALGPPVAELRDFALPVDPTFVRGVERTIERRKLAGELVGLTAVAPWEALLALLRIPFEWLGARAPGRDG
jgi:hypothetical protein